MAIGDILLLFLDDLRFDGREGEDPARGLEIRGRWGGDLGESYNTEEVKMLWDSCVFFRRYLTLE